MDALGNPIAPTISVVIEKAIPAAPRLTVEGPKDNETVQ
jgi:hypothetical protein